jgi:hypothetical protein
VLADALAHPAQDGGVDRRAGDDRLALFQSTIKSLQKVCQSPLSILMPRSRSIWEPLLSPLSRSRNAPNLNSWGHVLLVFFKQFP